MDIVKELGHLCLATRLKRIGDRLQSDVQRLIDAREYPLMANQYPILAAIDRAGPMTIGDISRSLGVSQPGVTRSVNALGRNGIVRFESPAEDRRRKVVALSRLGQKIVDSSKSTLWPAIEAELVAICGDTGNSLLRHLDTLETELSKNPLSSRVDERPQEEA